MAFKILVIGDSCNDVYHYGVCERISPEAPVPVLKHKKTVVHGGMSNNVANNLAGLGNEVDLITNSEAITKERFIDENSMHHLLRFDVGECVKLSPLSEEKINNIDFNSYSAIVISDYEKGFISNREISLIVSKVKDLSISVFVDSKKKNLSMCEGCIIKINEHEYDSISSFPENYELIITRGKNGAVWNKEVFSSAKSEIDDLDITSIKSLRSANVSGAGDTFLAGLVHEYLSSRDMKKAIRFANLCGSRAIENFGTYVINLEDLD